MGEDIPDSAGLDVESNIKYTITVTNNGPDDATNVVVTDILPPRLGLLSASPLPCSFTPFTPVWQFPTILTASGIVRCTIANIPAGQSRTITVHTIVAVLPVFPANSFHNYASADSIAFDPNPDNNKKETNATVQWADLSVTAFASAGAVEAGQPLTLSYSVNNAGPSSATDVKLTVTLPSGAVYQSAQGASCTPASGGGGTTIITCTFGTLPANNDATASILVVPTVPGTLSATATVSALNPDPNGVSPATASAMVVAADITLAMTASVNPVAAGANTRIDMRVANSAAAGGPTARSVTLTTDQLPTGANYVSSIVTDLNLNPRPGASCNFASRVLICTVGDMPPGDQAIVQMVVTPGLKGSLTIPATAAALYDPNANNNRTSLTLSVIATACSQRPPVTVSTANAGDGRLSVTVTAGSAGVANNRLEALSFGQATNSVVEVNGQLHPGGNFTHAFGDRPSSFTFYVRRQTAGSATTVPFQIVDHCASPWNTFVGGGLSAF